jgi:5-methylcytosine-specific restriction endonuclease McrA
MLREAANAEFVTTRRLFARRFRFVAGRTECEAALSRREHAEHQRLQVEVPVAVAEQGRRRYWWFHDRFWWEDDGLAADDVMALVLERERRARRRLERARSLMHSEPAGRTALTLDVKRAVWQRCGGRCAECGSDQLLEFDHVIPLAMGGSNSERNLQLLCAECNRLKGSCL